MSEEHEQVEAQKQVEEQVETPAPDTEPIVDAVAALTADLQRLQAEYSNYRKRVERDRDLAREVAVGSVLGELLPVLDDLDRARAHGELEGGFKAVAEQIERIVARIGLEKFGTAGEPFDPMIHEALIHNTSSEVMETTASEVLQSGYKYKDRVLRPARVAVTDPE